MDVIPEGIDNQMALIFIFRIIRNVKKKKIEIVPFVDKTFHSTLSQMTNFRLIQTKRLQ